MTVWMDGHMSSMKRPVPIGMRLIDRRFLCVFGAVRQMRSEPVFAALACVRFGFKPFEGRPVFLAMEIDDAGRDREFQ